MYRKGTEGFQNTIPEQTPNTTSIYGLRIWICLVWNMECSNYAEANETRENLQSISQIQSNLLV